MVETLETHRRLRLGVIGIGVIGIGVIGDVGVRSGLGDAGVRSGLGDAGVRSGPMYEGE